MGALDRQDERVTDLETRVSALEWVTKDAVSRFTEAVDNLTRKIEVSDKAQEILVTKAVETFATAIPVKIVVYFFVAISLSFSAGAGIKAGFDWINRIAQVVPR